MTCGERRPTQSGFPKSNELRGEKISPVWVLEVRRPAGREDTPSQGVSATSTSGRTQEFALPQPAGGPRSLCYLNQREEPRSLCYLNSGRNPGACASSTSGRSPGDRATSTINQPGESGDKLNLDQRQSTGDQTLLLPGDKKIIVSGRDQSLVRGLAGVRGFPCMGYNSAQRGAITCWETGSLYRSGIREADVLDFRLPGDGYYNMREE